MRIKIVFFITIVFALFIAAAVYFKLPAKNDESLIGLKGIMLMILFVVNTSSHSLYSVETYYIYNKCNMLDKNGSGLDPNIKKSLNKLIMFNSLILSSSFLLIVSILSSIGQTVFGDKQEIFMRISFYSFLLFLIMIILDYLTYNLMFYKSIKKIF